MGGPTTHEIRTLLRELKGLNIVAADLVEIAPMYDPTEVTQLAGATVAYDLLQWLA